MSEKKIIFAWSTGQLICVVISKLCDVMRGDQLAVKCVKLSMCTALLTGYGLYSKYCTSEALIIDGATHAEVLMWANKFFVLYTISGHSDLLL